MAAHQGRAFFALYGYHFHPDDITRQLGLEPTSTDASGARSGLDKPVISSWEFSTATISSDNQELDLYKLMDDDLLKKIEPSKDKIIELCKGLNLSPRISIVLTLSTDKNEAPPEVGFGARLVKFCAEIGAFINVDYKLSDQT